MFHQSQTLYLPRYLLILSGSHLMQLHEACIYWTRSVSTYIMGAPPRFQSRYVVHISMVPYHPASNGLAERAVKTFKSTLKKLNTGSLQSQVNDFLFKYCITPQMTTGISPAQLMMRCQLHSHLDLLLPNIADKVHHSQSLQKQAHDYHARDRQLLWF